MPSPLQKVARGFLGLLDQKTLGVNPQLTSETVVPTIEMADFYGIDLRRVVSQAGSVTAFGDTDVLSVPQSQIWRVHSAFASLNFAAAETAPDGVHFSLAYGLISGGDAVRVATVSEALTAPAATVQFTASVVFPVPLILPPGSRWVCVNLATLGQATDTFIAVDREALAV